MHMPPRMRPAMMSVAKEDDIKVIPERVDDTQVESSKPVGAISAADKEV